MGNLIPKTSSVPFRFKGRLSMGSRELIICGLTFAASLNPES